MKISHYIKEFTSGRRYVFLDVVDELMELIAEVVKINRAGMKEEFGDTLHFFQLWLFWRFGIDGEPWRITQGSIDKFIARKAVWNKIYAYVGLPENICGYLGNYKRIEKVVRQLGRYGVAKDRAEEAFAEIVGGDELKNG